MENSVTSAKIRVSNFLKLRIVIHKNQESQVFEVRPTVVLEKAKPWKKPCGNVLCSPFSVPAFFWLPICLQYLVNEFSQFAMIFNTGSRLDAAAHVDTIWLNAPDRLRDVVRI